MWIGRNFPYHCFFEGFHLRNILRVNLAKMASGIIFGLGGFFSFGPNNQSELIRAEITACGRPRYAIGHEMSTFKTVSDVIWCIGVSSERRQKSFSAPIVGLSACSLFAADTTDTTTDFKPKCPSIFQWLSIHMNMLLWHHGCSQGGL